MIEKTEFFSQVNHHVPSLWSWTVTQMLKCKNVEGEIPFPYFRWEWCLINLIFRPVEFQVLLFHYSKINCQGNEYCHTFQQNSFTRICKTSWFRKSKKKIKKIISIIRNVCKKTLINSKFWQPSYVTIIRYIVSVIIIIDRLNFVSHIQVLPINIIVSWMMIVILHKNIVYYIIRVINNTVEKI